MNNNNDNLHHVFVCFCQVKYNEERQEMIKQGLLHTDKVESSNIHSKSSFPVYSDLQISPDESHKGTK